MHSLPEPHCSLSDNPGPGQRMSALSTLSPTKRSYFSHETTKCTQQLVGEKWGFQEAWKILGQYQILDICWEDGTMRWMHTICTQVTRNVAGYRLE